ncbi:MAG: endonuclease/exonuclease/phosphatase family protein [Clostridia bacterium]|nr:endonuclease/exonuclease/phosphatase family protein [Clostridia bacterium]
MKVMTFNVQHLLGHMDREKWVPKDIAAQIIEPELYINSLKEIGADVVGLQEMRNQSETSDKTQYFDQTKVLADGAGYKYYYFAEAIKFGGINPYGNAIISKIPIVKAETIIIPDPVVQKYNGYYETRCVLKAQLINGYTILVSHIGLNPDEHENAVKTILENLPKEKGVLMGDFNMQSNDELLKPFFEKLNDTTNLIVGNKNTFPSDSPNIKIDYIFTTKDVVVEEAKIPNIVVSDHLPYIAKIKE